MTNECTKTAPERIYLQVSEDANDADRPFPKQDVTWCEDSVVDCEVEYVRADLATQHPQTIWHTEEPPDGKFVLVKCQSGYTTTPWVYTTARKQREYRGDAWIDHANDRLSDWGMDPVAWTELPQE